MKTFLKIFLMMMMISPPSFAQNRLLDEGMLTENEKLLCTRFKALKGQERYGIMMKLHHLFPSLLEKATNRILNDTSKAIITKQTLVSMLGEPDDIQDGNACNYVLYSPNCMAQFFISDDKIVFHAYANCPEKREKEKK